MSAATVVPHPVISEAELIELENQLDRLVPDIEDDLANLEGGIDDAKNALAALNHRLQRIESGAKLSRELISRLIALARGSR